MKTNLEICKAFARGDSESYCNFYNNIFFETDLQDNRTLYSYGHHFAIARIDPAGNCFFTTRSYSVTTAKHISLAASALRYYKLINCPYPDNSAKSFEYWRKELEYIEKDLVRARNKARRGDAINKIVNEIKTYCGATGCKRPGYLSKFVRIANTLQPTKAAIKAVKGC